MPLHRPITIDHAATTTSTCTHFASPVQLIYPFFTVLLLPLSFFFFFFNDTATTEIYTLSLHDALPISAPAPGGRRRLTPPHPPRGLPTARARRRAISQAPPGHALRPGRGPFATRTGTNPPTYRSA